MKSTVTVTFFYSSQSEIMRIDPTVLLEDALKEFLTSIGYKRASLMMKSLKAIPRGFSEPISNWSINVGSLVQDNTLTVDCWRV